MPGADSAALVGSRPPAADPGELSTLAAWAAAGAPAGPASQRPLDTCGAARPVRPGAHGLARPQPLLHAPRDRRRARRLPLLRPRPEARAERLRDGGAHPTPADGQRPPRDPLRGGRGAGGRCDAAERPARRRRLDVLRRPRPAGRPGELGLRRSPRPATLDRGLGARAHLRTRSPRGRVSCCTRARRS